MQYPESAASVEQTGMTSVREYALIASRNKWVIVGAIALSLTLAVGYLLIAPQYYRSQALIVVEERKELDQVFSKGESADEHFEKQLFLIQKQIISEDFLGVIAKEFSLRRDGSDGPGEVAGWAELARMTRIERPMIDPAGGKSSQNLVNGFVVSFLDRDPQTARQVTARIADKFIEENNREREKEIEGTGEFLEEELRLMKRELEKREENISSFKKSHLGNLPQQTDTNLRALDRVEAEISGTNESLQRHSDRLGTLNQEVHLYRTTGQSNFRGTTRSMEPDPLFRHLKELREKLVKLRAEFWDGYPEVILTKEEIRQTEEELTNVYGPDALRADKTTTLDPVLQDLLKQQSEERTEIALLRQRLDQLRTTKRDLERRLDRSPAVEQELLVLERDYNNLKNNYAMLLDKRLHTRVEENIGKRQKGGKYRILDRANLPKEPAIPNRTRILALGFLFGCVLGAGLSVLREHLTSHFRNAEDVEVLLTGPRLLAAIPDFSSLWRTASEAGYFQTPALPRPLSRMTMGSQSEIVPSRQPLAERSGVYEIDRRFVAKMFPRSMAAEQYRVAAARLQLVNTTGEPMVVAVTSAIKGEGKTTTVINLGYTLARDFGRRVLVLDCDFVYPELRAFLESPVRYGLIDCLRSDIPVQQAMGAFTDVPCWIMPAGESVADSTDLLRAGQIGRVLAQLREEFDYILINAPPILPVATMNVLESHCDFLILVVRANLTSKQAVTQAIGSLRADRPIHVILNGVASNSLPSYMLDYAVSERQVAV